MLVILASASPRRRELLEKAGIVFKVVASPVEELHDPAMAPAALCEENAARKAADVAARHPDATVIGADTLVYLEDQPMGKPADLAAAREMLRQLSDRTHVVCTGVCIVRPGAAPDCFHDLTEVDFLPLDAAAIDAYFALVNPLDKAGAYGIQEHGGMIVKTIRGNFDTVMGLPVAKLLDKLS